MYNMNRKLAALEAEGKPIQVGVVGAGQMGRGMVTELVMIKGERPAICADINIDLAVHAFEYGGVHPDQIVKTTDVEEASAAIKAGKYVATNDSDLVTKVPEIDVVVDVTGVPDVGAKIALDAIAAKKHIIMMNVESDVVIGPYLYKKAQEAGVVYTGTNGDEPGAVMELYDFAEAMGLKVEVIGKGKNNRIDRECNPDTVLEEATRRKMSPKMLCAFKDGTKTMVEMAAMSNATGLVPDVIGGHGIACDVKGLNDMYRLKEDDGILNKHGVVEYVRGIAPGVFVTVSTDNEEIAYQMQYHSMGPGPLWTLYRPYHLCNLETPLTVAKLVIDKEPQCVPIDGLVAECITRAKIDLKAGQTIDGMGGYTTHGSICEAAVSDENKYVPYGLVTDKAVMKRDVKKGQLITLDDIQLDTSTYVYKLRQEQDKIYGKTNLL